MAIDAKTIEPLIPARRNEQSLKQTLQIGGAVYHSSSQQEIWHEGETSGDTQKILKIRASCDQAALILYVDQQREGPCHRNRRFCFYQSVTPGDPSALAF